MVPPALIRKIPVILTVTSVPVPAVTISPVAPADAVNDPPRAAAVLNVVASRPTACQAADVKVAVPAPTILNPIFPDVPDIEETVNCISKKYDVESATVSSPFVAPVTPENKACNDVLLVIVFVDDRAINDSGSGVKLGASVRIYSSDSPSNNSPPIPDIGKVPCADPRIPGLVVISTAPFSASAIR